LAHTSRYHSGLLPEQSRGNRLDLWREFPGEHRTVRPADELAILQSEAQHSGSSRIPHHGRLFQRNIRHPPGQQDYSDVSPALARNCINYTGQGIFLWASVRASPSVATCQTGSSQSSRSAWNESTTNTTATFGRKQALYR